MIDALGNKYTDINMDWNIPEPGGRIAIPSREYKANTEPKGSTLINRPQSSQSNREEKKIQLPARPYQQPVTSNPPPPVQSLNPGSQVLSQNLKQKFEELRLNLDKKLQSRLKQAEDDYNRRIKEIKQDSDQEKNNLLVLEQLALAEVSKQAQSLIPVIAKEPAKPVLSVPDPSTQPVILVGYDNQASMISRDLKTVQPLKTPKDFTKGGGLLLVKKDKVLIVYGNGKVSLLNLTKNQLTNLSPFPDPRTYFTLAMLGKNPAVIGGLLASSSPCNVVSLLKNMTYWDNGPAINNARSHARGIKHKDSTYLFAGFRGGAISSIEMFFDDQWAELSVEMPASINHFGLCSKGNEIFLFGGEDSHSIYKSVYTFDTTNEKFFKKKKNLESDFSCRNDDCVKCVGNEFFLLSVGDSKVIKYF